MVSQIDNLELSTRPMHRDGGRTCNREANNTCLVVSCNLWKTHEYSMETMTCISYISSCEHNRPQIQNAKMKQIQSID